MSRYLAEVERGREYIIARGKKSVARLVPIEAANRKPRPKAGRIRGQPFVFPASAFSPLSESELKAWGL